MSQTLSSETTWWCLSVLNLTWSMSWICLAIYYEICILGKIYLKSHGLPEFVLSPHFGSGNDEKFGRPWNLIHSPPCTTPWNFSSTKSFSGLQAFTFVCEVNVNGLRPFDQWELLDYTGYGPSVCVWSGLDPILHDAVNHVFHNQFHS